MLVFLSGCSLEAWKPCLKQGRHYTVACYTFTGHTISKAIVIRRLTAEEHFVAVAKRKATTQLVATYSTGTAFGRGPNGNEGSRDVVALGAWQKWLKPLKSCSVYMHTLTHII